MTPAQLRAELDHHGLTPKRFAAIAGVTFSAVYKWLRGGHPIPLSMEKRLAEWRAAGVPGEGEKT